MMSRSTPFSASVRVLLFCVVSLSMMRAQAQEASSAAALDRALEGMDRRVVRPVDSKLMTDPLVGRFELMRHYHNGVLLPDSSSKDRTWGAMRHQLGASETATDFRYGWRKDLGFKKPAAMMASWAEIALDVEKPSSTRSSFWNKRARAAQFLFRIKDASQPNAVAARLKDSNPLVVAYSARLLGALKHEAAVGPLAAVVLERKERTARVNALRALGQIGKRGALPAVMAAMTSSDPHLQRTGLETLAALAKTKALDAKDRRGLATLVYAMLTNDPTEDVRRAAVLPLRRLSEKAFEVFGPTARLKAGWPVRAAYAGALADGDQLKLDALETFLADPDRRVVAAAAEALATSKSAKAQKRLGRLIDESEDEVILSIAMAALKVPTPEDKPGRVQHWSRIENVYSKLPASQAEAKQACLKAAEALNDDQTPFFLRAVAEKDPELAIRTMARAALKKLGADKIPAHRPLSPSDEGRLARVKALVQRKEPLFALIKTSRGDIKIQFHAKKAPFTVDNFVELARAKYYDGILFHRVIPDFVAQAGCPRGDGWGGPGYSIRCEINELSYERGTIGMALAGQDTGGSQWFICFQPQPHLDGRYPIFAQVVEGWDAVDALVQGDVIESVKILD